MARYEIRIPVPKQVHQMAEEITKEMGEKSKSKALRHCVINAIRDEHSAWVKTAIKKG